MPHVTSIRVSLASLALLAACAAWPMSASAQGAPDPDQISALIDAGRAGEARERLLPAVRDGDATAQALLADMLRRGVGVAQDFQRAVELNRAAAGQGNAMAHNALGQAYASGLGVAADRDQALFHLREAAESGAPAYQVDYGLALEDGLGGTADPAGAARWYEEAAGQGFAPAMTSLGVLYYEGRGVERDTVEAIAQFRAAAELGDARAQNNLGLILVRGEEVERDYEAAFALFQAAVDQGLEEAFGNLSVMYANGFGVATSETEAARLLEAGRRAGALALPALLERIGFPYDPRLREADWDVEPGPEDIAAASAGDPVALYRMAWRRLNGYGVRQNFDAAVQLFEQASEAGLGSGAFALGLMYARGTGVPQDFETAYVWMSVAARRGNMNAAIVRDALIRILPAGRVEQAQERVSAQLPD
ncbi:tetratricopeptide repeat protein [Maricaulis sp.]|uniref:SEL1-like repeat protein n=1 Tax=Maricaulis sp. TaxID=1486257 RepID=UPI0025C3FA03|nr:tetratricopeptide repeat protein [Maricaulis sp.]